MTAWALKDFNPNDGRVTRNGLYFLSVDYLYMVNRKLDFIGFVYRTAVQPFQSAILAIELGEPPYYAGDYDGDGGPPFLTEWTEFNDGRLALGNLSLSLVAVALQEFLAASAENMRLGTPPKLNKKSWLERYRVLIKKTWILTS